MIGGGFINDMRKTMERNRSLLQRKVALQKKQSVRKRLVILISITLVVSLASWTVINTKLPDPDPILLDQKEYQRHFRSELIVKDSLHSIRIDFYGKHRVCESHLLNDVKHGRSKSYYISGELFREARYVNGLLKEENFFFKSGESVTQRELSNDNLLLKIADRTPNDSLMVTLKYWDGKIIPGTYKEYCLLTGKTFTE
ncbi:MAG: hypothetical protein AAGG59_06620 [Bacteroidota bacterium]